LLLFCTFLRADAHSQSTILFMLMSPLTLPAPPHYYLQGRALCRRARAADVCALRGGAAGARLFEEFFYRRAK
jgi:hypothetical protein